MLGRATALAALIFTLTGCSDDSKTPTPDRTVGKDVPVTAKDLPVMVDRKPDSPRAWPSDGRAAEARGPDQGKRDSVASPDGPASCGKLLCDCTAYSTKQGKLLKLWGEANEVTFNADFKVKRVTFNGQLKVKSNATIPLKCGEWKGGSSFPVFTYQVVTIGEDFTIQDDNTWPGINTAACLNCK